MNFKDVVQMGFVINPTSRLGYKNLPKNKIVHLRNLQNLSIFKKMHSRCPK